MRIKTKQSGSIIAFTLIVLSLMLTSGLAVITVASLEQRSGLVTQKSVVAFQAADSGAERILERIYIDNSPPIMTVPANGAMTDATLAQLVSNLMAIQVGATCNGTTDKMIATGDSSPVYTFQAALYDGSGNIIDCTDTAWRDKAVRLRVEGFYRQTARVIELGIKPRPKCDTSDTVTDATGNNYDLIQIGDQCWMQQNMRVGSQIPSGTPQTDNGGGINIEYYCYNNVAGNCTSNHPNHPDGGLYTWDEAMQYVTNEGAQGICPNNFHIPTDTDWYTLENHIDSTINNPGSVGYRGVDAGTKLKPGGTSGSEFNLTGYRNSGSFNFRDTQTYLWSSSLFSPGVTWSRALTDTEARSFRGTMSAGGLIQAFVRCVAD